MEARLALRLAMAVTFLVLLAATAAAGEAYGYGPPGPRRAILLIVVILLIYARLYARRSGGKAPEFVVRDAARRGGRRLRELVAGAVAALHRARRRGRVRQVERAALDAAEDHDALSPESVRTAAESLFRLVHLAWEARDAERLAKLLGPELLAERRQRLAALPASGPRERQEVVGDVRVEYVGFSVPEPGNGPRAVVLIEATLRADSEHHRGRRSDGDPRRLCQYWTLGRRDGLWTVLDIEERAEGKHHLAEPIGV